jgi:hypothetical protein
MLADSARGADRKSRRQEVAMCRRFGRACLLCVFSIGLLTMFAGEASAQTFKFKVVNDMGTAVRVRLIHFDATFDIDNIAKDAEFLSGPGRGLVKGPRAVIVFDNPSGKILLLGQKEVTEAVTIKIAPTGVSYEAY